MDFNFVGIKKTEHNSLVSLLTNAFVAGLLFLFLLFQALFNFRLVTEQKTIAISAFCRFHTEKQTSPHKICNSLYSVRTQAATGGIFSGHCVCVIPQTNTTLLFWIQDENLFYVPSIHCQQTVFYAGQSEATYGLREKTARVFPQVHVFFPFKFWLVNWDFPARLSVAETTGYTAVSIQKPII